MKKLSEVPFISISKENLMAASDMLDREQMGELMEMIIDAVLNDGQPSSNNKCVNGVFNQFMAVIERKASGYAKRVDALDAINEERKKQREVKPNPNPKESNYDSKIEEAKPKENILTPKQVELLRQWYGILSQEDNDRYFNSSWNQFFDDYETAKIAANDYLSKNLRKHKSWLM